MTATEQQTAVDLWLAAEDHFLHGHLLSSWVVDYVDLEQSLAIGPVAQEELAHAATYLSLSGLDEAGRDDFVYERPVETWHPTRLLSQRLHDWPATVVRGVLLSHAALLRAEVLCASDSEPVRAAGAVIAAEQQLHVTHWQRWARLLSGDPRTASEFGHRVAAVVPLGQDMFGTVRDADPASGRRLHQSWTQRVASALDDQQMVAEALGAEPLSRSAGTDHPELVEVFGEIRGIRLGPDDGVRGLYR